MQPILREHLLKGLFLGLWAYFAILQEPRDWQRGLFVGVLLVVAAGLICGLLAAALLQVRRGYRPGNRWKIFPLIVLVESPFWIQLGIVGGLGASLAVFYDPPAEKNWLGYCALAGCLLGFGFYQLRSHRDYWVRVITALVVGGLLIYLGIEYLSMLPGFDTPEGRQIAGSVILAGLPFFYLLVLSGEADESEVEIAALCAGLGIGLYLTVADRDSPLGSKFVLVLPLLIYVVYVTRWLPHLLVFKNVLRGYSALQMGRQLDALRAFRRALALRPRDELARHGMWELHEQIDIAKLPADSPLLANFDYNFWLEQAAGLLIRDRSPTPDERTKAEKMLDLVARHRSKLAPKITYLRAILRTHEKAFDEAARLLGDLFDPQAAHDARQREEVLFDAWNLALRLHPELARRLSQEELSKPGRRMQAIAAVERRLAIKPTDPAARQLQEMLYTGLQEDEFAAAALAGPPADFNYDYVEQLGLALIESAESRARGMAFLRIAGRGLPERGVGIFSKLAELAEQAGDSHSMLAYCEQVKRCGLQVGPKRLPEEYRRQFQTAVKRLAEAAEQRGDFTSAIADYRLLLECGGPELDRLRKLADLYERGGDAMNALLITETALVYQHNDPDLIARKDRYYYSVSAERLQSVKDKVEQFFDVDYCLSRARQVLDQNHAEDDTLDWALHLARLARIMQPNAATPRWLEARGLLRQGKRTEALQVLEDLRELKPASQNDEGWYAATKMLGDLYLNELDRPDLAVRCYLDYRDYLKSGADTLFNAAKCYERLGDVVNACRFYELVTAYEQHPRYWEARSALERLKLQNPAST